MESKREALLKEASENRLSGSLQEKLAEVESMKLQPYGTLDAVRSFAFNFYCEEALGIVENSNGNHFVFFFSFPSSVTPHNLIMTRKL